MLILHIPDALQHTSPDSVAQVLSGGFWVDVPEVNRPVQRLVSAQAAKAVHAIHAIHPVHPVHPVHAIHPSEFRSERQVGGHGRPEVALILHGREGSLSDEGLGRSGLCGLCGGLLRLGNVCASILAVVDALPCPGGLCRESVDDLRLWSVSIANLSNGENG